MVRIGTFGVAGATLVMGMVVGCATSLPGTPTPATVPVKATATVTVTAADSPRLGTQVFDRAAVESDVVSLIRNSYNMDATEASCPKAEETEVAPGNTFDCTVVIAGEKKTVTITVKDASGKYEVSVPN